MWESCHRGPSFVMNQRARPVLERSQTRQIAGRRYIVCRNHEEAKKDAADRAAILTTLERQLKKGDKARKKSARSPASDYLSGAMLIEDVRHHYSHHHNDEGPDLATGAMSF
jgi:hypothetical protein